MSAANGTESPLFPDSQPGKAWIGDSEDDMRRIRPANRNVRQASDAYDVVLRIACRRVPSAGRQGRPLAVVSAVFRATGADYMWSDEHESLPLGRGATGRRRVHCACGLSHSVDLAETARLARLIASKPRKPRTVDVERVASVDPDS